MTVINPDTVLITAAADLPARWAAELGLRLARGLDVQARDLLQERVVGLGHGVQLAHIRSHLVQEPTLGAYKAADAGDESHPWLWLVVLVPAGDPSRHLGWMAHLAAGLHETARREMVFAADDAESLRRALRRMLAPRTATSARPVLPASEPDAARPSAASTATHRLIIAILKEVEMVDHLLALYVDHEVRGATILEARGMAEHLSAHMSLFAGFKSAFKAVGHSQVILTLVPVERTDEVLELVRAAAGGMRMPGSGIAFAVDVPQVIGLQKDEEEDGA